MLGSVNRIAEAAGLTTGAFYYHFNSKEGLADAIIDEGWPNTVQVLTTYVESPTTGLSTVIAMTFDMLDIVNRNNLQWIGFHINQAIGHLSPNARNEYFQRVEMFFELVTRTINPSELREDVTPREAGELIWMGMNGAQLLSDAVGESGSALFARLTATWRAILRAIVSPDSFAAVEASLIETATGYPRITEENGGVA